MATSKKNPTKGQWEAAARRAARHVAFDILWDTETTPLLEQGCSSNVACDSPSTPLGEVKRADRLRHLCDVCGELFASLVEEEIVRLFEERAKSRARAEVQIDRAFATAHLGVMFENQELVRA